MSGPSTHSPAAVVSLASLTEGESGVLETLHMSADAAGRLMALGFVPGSLVTAAAAAPGGDPRVYRVDGGEVALRRETARRITVVP